MNHSTSEAEPHPLSLSLQLWLLGFFCEHHMVKLDSAYSTSISEWRLPLNVTFVTAQGDAVTFKRS